MLIKNTIEIQTNKSIVNILSAPYPDGNWEYARELRTNYPTYEFYRDRGKMYCWSSIPNNPGKEPDGFSPCKVSAERNPFVWSSILEKSFINLFKSKERKVFYQKYAHTWGLELAPSTNDQSTFDGLLIQPILHIGFHALKADARRKNYVFCVSLRKTNKLILSYSDEEYTDKQIDLRGWDRNENGELVSSSRNIKRLLSVTKQNNKYQAYKRQSYSTSVEYADLQKFYNSFEKIRNKVHLPDGLQMTELLLMVLPNSHFNEQKIRKPQYYFHNEKTGRGFYNDRLQVNKPYSYDVFKDRKVRILVLTPKEYEGSAGSFSNDIGKILRDMFHLRDLEMEMYAFDHTVAFAYSNVLKKLDFSGYDTVLQIVSASDKLKPIERSPYYIFKAKMLNQKVSSQKVLIETVRLDNRSIKNEIALNIYTKIGGTAWTIEKDEKDRAEIIIGISSTVDFRKRRIKGFANVHDFRGNYISSGFVPMTDLTDYKDHLQHHLIQTISNVIQDKGIQKGEEFRLIFHLTKEAGKRSEIAAIESTLNFFRGYKIQFGIVHLSYSHNFRLYNDQGKQPVDRGTFVQLSSNMALLHMGGKSKTPILVRLDKRSTFDDIFDSAKQVLIFSHLSHRSFKPSSKPVTILYPTVMAKLLSELGRVSDWDQSIIDEMQDRPWFI